MNETTHYIDLKKIKLGDRLEFAKLVESTSPRIYRVALQILGNEQDAEDVLQETYIKAWGAIASFEGRSSLTTWLHRIAVNEALMMIRKRRPNTFSVDEQVEFNSEEESEGMEIVDFCCLPESELLSDESQKFLDAAVEKLPESLRTVFVLRDLEGFSIQETADTLKLSENNIKTRLLRARLKLRQELSSYYAERVKKESAQ